MLAQQRHREILARLQHVGGVRVSELAEAFGVAEETIRRDLEKLDANGKLIRTHGGAVPIVDVSQDLPFNIRRSEHHDLKEIIAPYAAHLVSEGDVIALDASSTVHELARTLPDIPLTVVTNSLPVTATLMAHEHVRVLSTGGVLDRPSRSWVGSFAEDALARVNIQKLFLSSKGIDIERGLSEVDDAQARVKRRMIDLAEEVYLLVDHSKLGKRAAVFLANVDEVDRIIVDADVDPVGLEQLRTVGIAVETATAVAPTQ